MCQHPPSWIFQTLHCILLNEMSLLLTTHIVGSQHSVLFRPWRHLPAVLSVGASSQSLAGYFRLTLLFILVKKLKIRKISNKNNCDTSASNVWVEMKAHFRSFERVYLSHARWKLIEGFWNACDIFREQDPARNRLKIMKRSRKNNCKTSGSNVRV